MNNGTKVEGDVILYKIFIQVYFSSKILKRVWFKIYSHCNYVINSENTQIILVNFATDRKIFTNKDAINYVAFELLIHFGCVNHFN